MKVKKIVLMALFIVVFALQSFATLYHVYNGDSIQNVITNLASHGDRIQVHNYSGPPYYGQYKGFHFNGKDLHIFNTAYPRPIINGDLSSPPLSIVIDMTSIYNPSTPATPELEGFKIIGDNDATGVKLTNFTGNVAIIENNIIDGIDKAIYVGDNEGSIDIYLNELLNNDYAYYSIETLANQGFPDDFNCNIFYDNGYGLYLGNLSRTGALSNSFYNNDTGIFNSLSSEIVINSSIIYGNNTQIDNNGTLTITYSDIEDGYTGTGNIDADPLFCFEYPYEYYLMEGSPCIDTGDPTQTDSDGTRVDMGCYPTIVDIKYCEGNYWNWVSFPRLDRDDDDAVDVPPLLEDFLDWPFDLLLEFEDNTDLYYDGSWHPTSYDVKSSLGYKLDPQDNGDHYLPSQNGATRLLADWELRYTLPHDTDNWMGYWLPYTQNIKDAFGEFWDIVKSVEAEDWYYEYSDQETPTSSTTDKNMVYGKAYIVVFGEDVEEFYWTDDIEEAEQRERMDSEYFSYNDLPSYEVIDVMDIPQNVLEIGVFEDDLCVGALVVQDTCEQILVYSTNAIPFSFEIVINNREAGTPITSYQVLNKETGIYETRSLISGQQKSSVIMFGNLEDPQNETPVIDNVVLHGNYPNPFNPETKISFSLPHDQEIELTVYNLKGKKVRTLYTGITSSGEQSVVWNGKDDNGKPVGSGLYFYKLKTKDKVLTKKMLLLK